MTQQQPKHSFQDIFTLFFNPGEVCEIRAFGCGGKGPWDGWAKGTGIVFGYFNDPSAFAKSAQALENAGAPGIYFTLNPVMPDFLGRANNRLKAATNKTKTTADENTHIIRWLPVDLDPIRAAGGSDLNTSQEEFDSAWRLRNQIHEDIHKGRIADKGITAISGNGAHLIFRLPDLPNTEENKHKIRTGLAGIKGRWADPFVDIDQKVFNPARIWKLYGTTARKSDHTEQRPQRISRVQFTGDTCPILADIPVNDRILDDLAEYAPKEEPAAPKKNVVPMQKPTKKTARREHDNDLGPLDVEKYLSHHGMPPTKIKPHNKDGSSGTYYEIKHCLFNPGHIKESGIIQAGDGKLRYHCFHNSCHGRTWHDARTAISGTTNLAPFMEGYDPNKATTTTRQPEPPPYGTSARPTQHSGATSAAVAYQAGELPFIYLNKNGREAIDPAAAADWFEHELSPIYCSGPDKQFWQYDPCGVWKPYTTGKLQRTTRTILAEKAKPNWIKQIIEMLEYQCYRDDDETTIDPMYLNLKNGMWGIEEKELLPHDPKYNSKMQLPVNHDEDANCDPLIEAVHAMFKDDHLKMDTLQDFFGYCLYPKIIFPGVLFAIGDGGNGKGVIEHIINKMFGDNCVAHTSIKDMNEAWGPYELYGKYVNTVSETSPEKCDMTGFKAISAGDPTSAKIKYQVHPFQFRSFAKHFISMNQFPRMNEKTRSVYRRITVLEFEQNFEGKDNNPFLKEELEENLDGVFLWALAGLYRVLENKCFTTPESVMRGKERFKVKSSPLLSFVGEECTLLKNSMVSPPVLFKEYQQWCLEAGIKHPLGKLSFYEEIKLSFKIIKTRPAGSSVDVFKGIGLTATDHECEC